MAVVSVIVEIMATPVTATTSWREEEENKKGEAKKSPFSKQVGVVLERGNKFFWKKIRKS